MTRDQPAPPHPTPGDPLVEVTDVEVRFGSSVALHSVRLQLQSGELVAVVGPSGAGKTTLLEAISGVVAPARGQVRVGGRTIHTRPDSVAGGVALIPQDNALASMLTAQDNVLIPLLAAGRTGTEAAASATRALAAVGLTDWSSHLPQELSGGQQQRLAVARALALNPPVLLADEPTSELDHDNRELVLSRLAEHAAGGAAVLMTTHDPQVAQRASRRFLLTDGRLSPEPAPGTSISPP